MTPFHARLAANKASPSIAGWQALAEDALWALEAAIGPAPDLDADLADAIFILRFHNLTPTGRTRRCLPGCVACAFLVRLANPDTVTASTATQPEPPRTD